MGSLYRALAQAIRVTITAPLRDTRLTGVWTRVITFLRKLCQMFCNNWKRDRPLPSNGNETDLPALLISPRPSLGPAGFSNEAPTELIVLLLSSHFNLGSSAILYGWLTTEERIWSTFHVGSLQWYTPALSTVAPSTHYRGGGRDIVLPSFKGAISALFRIRTN